MTKPLLQWIPHLALLGLTMAVAGCGSGGSSNSPAMPPATLPAGSASLPTKTLWSISTGNQLPMAVVPDAARRPFIYAAQKTGGVVVYQLADPNDSQAATVAARVDTAQLGGLDAMNLVARGNRLYVALGDFFASGGSHAGLAIIDVAIPSVPVVGALWVSAHKGDGASHVTLAGDTAYLAAMREGVHLFDVGNPSLIVPLARLLPDVDFPKVNPGRVQYPNARGTAVVGDRLYVANDAGGLRVVDVSDARAPKELSKFVNPALLAKQAAYNNVVVHQGIAYVAVDYCGLEIIDVNGPTPTLLSWLDPWDCAARTNTWFNSGGHTNQLVLDTINQRIYLSAGDSELVVVDISNATAPKLLYISGGARNGRGAWGIGGTAEQLYLTYITSLVPFSGRWSGLRAFAAP